MVLAAFLCGLFYGAFGYAVYRKAERDRETRRVAKMLSEMWESDDECVCDECCGCGEKAPDFDFYAMTHTGYEDG